MGDVMMSTPAMEALRASFGCRITLLTSAMAAPIVPYLPCVDDVIIQSVPWVKQDGADVPQETNALVQRLQQGGYDGAIIFSVFSQSVLPTALVLYLAGIPLRLAYCRENPYQLLTHWLPDEEPFVTLRHQVVRDLNLVRSIGARVRDDRLQVRVPPDAWETTRVKLQTQGFNPERPWVLVHPGVSESRREYPLAHWQALVRQLSDRYAIQVVVSGALRDVELSQAVAQGIRGVYPLAGVLAIGEFIALVQQAPLVITVNTVTAHLAAATHTPVVVLYAMTNPQHFPWKVPGRVFLFQVAEVRRSRNAILTYMYDHYDIDAPEEIDPDDVVVAVRRILSGEEMTIEPLPPYRQRMPVL